MIWKLGASLILSDCSNLLILHYKKEPMRILGGCILNLFFAVIAFAEPYLFPNNPFIRHEIRLLSDEGGLTGLQNTWPLDLGGLSSMRNDLVPNCHTLCWMIKFPQNPVQLVSHFYHHWLGG